LEFRAQTIRLILDEARTVDSIARERGLVTQRCGMNQAALADRQRNSVTWLGLEDTSLMSL
jgi:hypothetical protein